MKRLIVFMLAVVITVALPIDVEANTQWENDRDKGYEDGYHWGEVTGAIYGQKDRINNKKSDWRKAYREERDDIEETYYLDDAPRNYRRGFLEGFEEGFEDGYKDAYDGAATESKLTAGEIGNQHGVFFGGLMGEEQGKNDYYNGLVSSWRRTLPSDGAISREFKLNYDVKEYADAFIRGYKTGYEEAYVFAYRVSNYDSERVTRENGVTHGRDIGEKAGAAAAMMDYVEGKVNQWSRALREFENQENLISRYGLFRENQPYRLGFIGGFKEGFKVGYSATYQDFNKATGEKNINYSKITMQGGSLSFEETIVHFLHGSRNEENRRMVELTIPTAAIYGESYMALQKEEIPLYYHGNYIPVSKAYEVKIMNDKEAIELRKPISLSFEYAGPYRGGIYQWKYNGWRYLYSKIEDGQIITEIPVTLYEGGRYAVFIDEDYVELRDIYTHWARQELYTFIRRGYSKGYEDGTLKPDQNISRGEFVALLNRMQNWQNTNTGEVLKPFLDQEDFGVFRQAISNAVARGYINGYPDKTFKPHHYITYQEIEWLMQRVTGEGNLSWGEMEEKMLYEKYTRSNSRFGKAGYITRAEVIYMLHELQSHNRI
ncbi:MAG: S-layer homology domain-containing protein [Clostridiaceae bacterium]|nr:S-layer homology domain-containing protein [Clostridiaceae bacterium]